MAYQPGPNDLLRVARLALRSPSGSGRPMSRQDLADAVNAHVYAEGHRRAVDARYVGRLERGEHRWPFEPYRTALREVLGKATTAELGFFVIAGHARDLEESPDQSGPRAEAPATAPGDDRGRSAAVSKAVGPVISVRVAAVQVKVIADDVTVIRRDGRTGAVAVLAGSVEVVIAPSDVALEGLAALPGKPATVAGRRQLYWLGDRRRSR